MHKFVRALLTEWRKLHLPFADAAFVVGVSGGADSLSLALALAELRNRKKLNLRFVVAHFNHDLRGEESRADEEFVKDFAGKFGFELAFRREKIAAGGNLEQNARRARYEFLLETAANLRADGVLTAHTQNDQAETFLLNLIRGSGLRGLGGMKTVRNLKSEAQTEEDDLAETLNQTEIAESTREISLIRPLLNWASRRQTENFCLENKIEFRHDAMNDDLAFKRVRIRKVLLPMLEDFNPKIVETLAKTAHRLQADFDSLEHLAHSTSKNSGVKHSDERNLPDAQTLETRDLVDLFPSMRRQILRRWLREARGNLRRLESRHFEAIENLISSRRSGKTVELPGGETVTKTRGKLSFENAKVVKTEPEIYNQGLDFKSAENAIENND